MSRAMNVSLPKDDVAAACKKADVGVSDIETLPTGGTHVVFRTVEHAETMRHIFKRNLIEGRVKRFAFYSLRAR